MDSPVQQALLVDLTPHAHPEITVRMARDEDGPRVGQLAEETGFTFDPWHIDWSKLGPWWIVAERAGEIVAAVQVSPAVPVARIELLSIDPGLSDITKGRVLLKLEAVWRKMAKEAGAQALCGMIPSELESYKNIAKRHGYVKIAGGDLMMARVV